MRDFIASLLRIWLQLPAEERVARLERRLLSMEGLWTLHKPVLDMLQGRAPWDDVIIADMDRALAAFLDVDHRGRPL